MSGGSYDYFFMKNPAESVLDYRNTLNRMIDRLIGMGRTDVATVLQGFSFTLNKFAVYAGVSHQMLEQVFHDIEWCDSCDIGEDDLKKTLDEFMTNYESLTKRKETDEESKQK